MLSRNSSELYQQVIMEHNRKPKNYGCLEGCTHKSEGFNPICGDHIWVYLMVSHEGTIEDVKFGGDGCAICKASASMMTTKVKGKSFDEVRSMVTKFTGMLKSEGGKGMDLSELGKLSLFSNVWKYPSRVKCATLSWYTLQGALNQEGSVSTE